MEKRILFVDDEETILKVMTALFRRQGYVTFSTTDGNEALAIAEREDVQVFFLDLRMPVMDGVELCRRIKRLQPESHCFALSAYVEAYGDEALKQVGFEGSFPKPFKSSDLLAVAAEAFEKLGIEDDWRPPD